MTTDTHEVDTCRHGHPLTADNIWWSPRRRVHHNVTYDRRCRTCRNATRARSRQRRQAEARDTTADPAAADNAQRVIDNRRRYNREYFRRRRAALRSVTGPDWHRAACTGADTDLFFTHDGENATSNSVPTRVRQAARAYCAACPIQKLCRSYAQQHGELGLWGGEIRRNTWTDPTPLIGPEAHR